MNKHIITLGVSILVLTISAPLTVQANSTINEGSYEISVTPASVPTPTAADNNSPAESTKKPISEPKQLTTTSIHQDKLPKTNESKSSVTLTLLGFTLLIGFFFNKNKFFSK